MVSEAFLKWIIEQYEEFEGLVRVEKRFVHKEEATPEERREEGEYILEFFKWNWHLGELGPLATYTENGVKTIIPEALKGEAKKYVFIRDIEVNGNVAVIIYENTTNLQMSYNRDNVGYITQRDGNVILNRINTDAVQIGFTIKNINIEPTRPTIIFRGLKITKL